MCSDTSVFWAYVFANVRSHVSTEELWTANSLAIAFIEIQGQYNRQQGTFSGRVSAGGSACVLILTVFTLRVLMLVDVSVFDEVCCLTSWTVHRLPPVF